MIRLFTHKDLDGSGCNIAFASSSLNTGEDSYEVTLCEVDESDYKINKFLDENDTSTYDAIFITDIPINEETAERLNAMCPDILKLIDHHKTALWLNKYPWAHVEVERESGKCSGTSLVYEYLDSIKAYEGLGERKSILARFVENVRRWDTWEWQDKYNDIEPRRLNSLRNAYKSSFDSMFINKIINNLEFFNEQDTLIITLEEERNEKYISGKLYEIVKVDFKGYVLGVVFADRCISELGNRMCKEDESIDLAVMIDPSRSMSFRTTKDIDCSEVAKIWNGGGHKYAAGCPYPKDLMTKIIQMTFPNE